MEPGTHALRLDHCIFCLQPLSPWPRARVPRYGSAMAGKIVALDHVPKRATQHAVYLASDVRRRGSPALRGTAVERMRLFGLQDR